MVKGNNKSSLFSMKTQSRLFILFASILAFQTFHLASKLSFAPTDGPASIPDGISTSSDPHSIGEILPDGSVTFTPEEFQAGRPENYVNLPNVPVDPDTYRFVLKLMKEPVPPPAETLLHEARNIPGNNAIVGLASYPHFMDGWLKLVGSLRNAGYDGHIIVGVNPDIPAEEREYLDRMGVTYYAIEVADCSASILEGTSNTGNAVRAKCSRGMEDMKLEWGRFEMARRWLKACESCTGWNMVIDTRDLFFQSDPFASLGDHTMAPHDLMFVEEIAQYTNTLPNTPHRAINIGESQRYKTHVLPCYGKDNVRANELVNRPMLCSGTVIGTSGGIHRFLSVLVNEFRENNEKGPKCRSPATTDQWTMNYLYYKGKFGYVHQTKTLPWGTGPVLTVGKPCVNSAIEKNGQSQKDMMVFDEEGRILNPHEKDGSITRVAPTLHQWDRCHKWITPWFAKHREHLNKDVPRWVKH